MEAVNNFRTRLLRGLAMAAARATRYALEFRIDHERFDPVLSRQLDCINFFIESERDEFKTKPDVHARI